MFVKACLLASGYTRPVVILSRTADGECASSVGACLVLNQDGWILTVAHLIKLIQSQSDSVHLYKKYLEDVRELEQDVTSLKQYRRKKLHSIERPAGNILQDHSVWWGMDGSQIRDLQILPTCDLALGRLEPFDPDSIVNYPILKVPGADYLPGRSLCKLGFAFHQITPEYDNRNKNFVLPKMVVPLPLFPLEGIFTRILLTPAPETDDSQAGKFIEISSPGLKGQSGGPIFDTEGTVWALQSHTRHYPLEFLAKADNKTVVSMDHQYLNAGVGVHMEPILDFLEQNKIQHQRSQ